jgi:hypothetical protein
MLSTSPLLPGLAPRPSLPGPSATPKMSTEGPQVGLPPFSSTPLRPCAAVLTCPFCWTVQEEPQPKATPAASGGEGSTSGSVVAPAPASASLLKPALRPTAIEFKPRTRLTAAANEFRPGGAMKVGSPSFVPGPSLSGAVKAPVVPAVTQPPQPSLVKEVRGHVCTHWSFSCGESCVVFDRRQWNHMSGGARVCLRMLTLGGGACYDLY